MSKINKLMAYFIFVLAFQVILPLSAEDNAIKEKILFYDDTYSVQYAGEMEPAIQYFTAHGFKLMNTPQLLKWIEGKIKTASCQNTVVLQISDITPKNLVEPWDKTSPLYRYCENGGRWVAPAGNTLYAFEGASDYNITGHGSYTKDDDKYITKCFGIHPVYGLRGKGSVLTQEGKDWGVSDESDKWMKYLQLGVPAKDVTPLVISQEGDAALIWYKNVNAKNPYSGLVGMCVRLSDYEPVLRLIHRICLFDGKPALIHARDWKPKTVTPELAVTFSATQGGIPRKAYQRGEVIPLSVTVYGSKYNGQGIQIRLQADGNVAWEKSYQPGNLKSFTRQEDIDTSSLRCGEYALEGIVDGKTLTREKIWVCPDRRNNSFPFFVAKGHRRNPVKEELALKYVRDNNVNVNIFDLYQFENVGANSKTAAIFGNYLDLILRNNLSANARPMAMKIYTDKPDEKLILYDGNPHKHGIREALSWLGFAANYLDGYRDSLRKQVSLLHDSKSPALVPYFITNDDASMGGNYDFNPLTLSDFKKKTGVDRKDLPPLEKMKDGNNVYMPVVPPGVVDDNHPWLQYFRYHCNNYNTICQAAMEGVESAWPGSLVADTGCMSGPLYVPRGYYPPLSFKAYNTAGFYQYLFWTYQYPFAIETALMNNRGKHVAMEVSAATIAWGEVFQRGMIYRILAESPEFVVFWSLDERNQDNNYLQEETWKGTNLISGKVSKVSEFLKLQEITQRKGALLFGLAQNCFKTTDRHFRPDYMSAALENFQRAGAKLDLLSTEEIMQDSLARYNVVFINSHQWMTKGEKKALEDYIENGGVVVADSKTTIDIKGALKADGPFAEGVNDIGKSAYLERCRKYVDMYLPKTILTPASENTIARVNKVGEVPIAWVFDVESPGDLGALSKAQSEDWDTGVYKYLKEKAFKEPTVNKKIMIKSGYYAYDLWNTKELSLKNASDKDWNVGELTVERFGAVPLVLYRDKIDKLICKSSTDSLNRGEVFMAVFELLSDNNTPVRELVPAEVTVYSPDGKEAWEYGGNKVIDNGCLVVRFSTAVNDATGKWKIVARELCSGKSSEVAFELKK